MRRLLVLALFVEAHAWFGFDDYDGGGSTLGKEVRSMFKKFACEHTRRRGVNKFQQQLLSEDAH